jgi:hypothetical protein
MVFIDKVASTVATFLCWGRRVTVGTTNNEHVGNPQAARRFNPRRAVLSGDLFGNIPAC